MEKISDAEYRARITAAQEKMAKAIFTLKKDGAKRHQQIFNFQFSIPR
jgi:hypothetical protein